MLSSCLGADATPGSWEIPFGPADVSAISGNGRLTVGVNEQGRVSVCRWPSPGYFDQLDYVTKSRELPGLGVAPWQGAMWAVRLEGETYWISGDALGNARQRHPGRDSTIIETTVSLGETGVRVRHALFVDPWRDLLVARIHIYGAETMPEIFWYQNFAPCTRLVPELPIGDWLLDEKNDFGAFFDAEVGRLYQFRPGVVTAEIRQQASGLADRGAPSVEWFTQFSESEAEGGGVWIGTSSPNAILGFQCGAVHDSTSAHRQIEGGVLGGKSSVVGQCNGGLALEPDAVNSSYRATVFVGFATGREGVDGNVGYALAGGYSELRRSNILYWENWLDEAGLTLTGNRDEFLRRRALLTMGQSVDRSTGGVVRAPITQPPLARVWARDTAWVSHALDRAGRHDMAGRALAFLGGAMRREGSRSAPRGSLPAAVYTNGVAGTPHFLVDVDAVSWLLSGCWRHASFLSGAARLAYLESMWDAVRLGGDFLAGWSREIGGSPVHSYQGALFRDGQSDESLIALFMGLQSAVLITEVLGEEENLEWSERLQDVQAMVLFQLVQGKSTWALERTLVYWLEGVIPRSHRIWRDIEVRVGEETVRLSEVTFPTAEILGQSGSFPNATESAFHFIAATHRIYGLQ